jgi:class 3 adenylate cyclase/tetratricopeptide (TPR) repeat protein
VGSKEERRVVTILFADVTGSTGLAERLDPEQVRTIMSRFFEAMTQEIARHEGTIEKYIGDEVMAVFGLPVTHEDDPERAVRAALAMHQRLGRLNAEFDPSWGVALQMRIGINTGEVVANPRAAEKGEFMVTGDAVNVAARLRGAAAPGMTVVGERTYHDTVRVAEYHSLPSLTVKGKTAPLAAWSLTGILAAPARRGLGGVHARLVGREDELTLLQGLLHRVIREGQPYMVTIIGMPGVGKTRLFEELRAGLPPSVVVRQGRSLPYGSTALWSVREIIRADAGVSLDDPLPMMAEKLRRRLDELLGEPRDTLEGRQLNAHLARVLGVPADDGETVRDGSRENLFWALRRYFERLAARSPLILVFEDVHWADGELLDFIEYLARWAAGLPLFTLCLARPDLLETRPGWGGGKRNHTSLFLEPLHADDTERLIRELLRSDTLPAGLSRTVAVAQGNPFFVEEILRMLIDAGTIQRAGDLWKVVGEFTQAVPDTVQGVLAARLDRLRPDERIAIQGASIIGKVFWTGALAHIAGLTESSLGSLLEALESRDLVLEHEHSALEGQREFSFRHILTHDVAYAMLPKATRCDKHRAFAGWMERMAGDRTEPYAEILAHHWLQAARLGREIGLQRDWAAAASKALEYSLAAGRRAARVYANDQARAHFEAARALALELGADSQRIAAVEGLADIHALGAQWEQASRLYQEALDYHLQKGDTVRQARVQSRIGSTFSGIFDFRQALPHIQSAMEALRSGEDQRELAAVYIQMARTQTSLGHFHEAEEFGRLGLRAAEQHNLPLLVSEGNHVLGFLSTLLGRPDATAYYTKSIEIAERLNDPGQVSHSYRYKGFYHRARGEYREARQALERALALAQETNNRPRIAWGYYSLGHVHFVTGDWTAAALSLRAYLAMSEEVPTWVEYARSILAFLAGNLPEAIKLAPAAVAHAEDRRDLPNLGFTLEWCAFLRLRLKQPAECRQLLADALARLMPVGVFWPAYLHPPAAEAALALGDIEGAAEHCRQAARKEWAEIKPAQSRLLRARGLLGIAQQRWDEGPVLLREAADLYGAIGRPYDRALCLETLSDSLRGSGREADLIRAEEALREAVEIYRRLGADFEVRRLRGESGADEATA